MPARPASDHEHPSEDPKLSGSCYSRVRWNSPTIRVATTMMTKPIMVTDMRPKTRKAPINQLAGFAKPVGGMGHPYRSLATS